MYKAVKYYGLMMMLMGNRKKGSKLYSPYSIFYTGTLHKTIPASVKLISTYISSKTVGII